MLARLFLFSLPVIAYSIGIPFAFLISKSRFQPITAGIPICLGFYYLTGLSMNVQNGQPGYSLALLLLIVPPCVAGIGFSFVVFRSLFPKWLSRVGVVVMISALLILVAGMYSFLTSFPWQEIQNGPATMGILLVSLLCSLIYGLKFLNAMWP